MRIGLLTLQLIIPASGSLKDKRRVIRPLVDRVRTRFNVSLAETDHQDLWQRCELAVAAVATNETGVQQLLDAAQETIESSPELECAECTREIW